MIRNKDDEQQMGSQLTNLIKSYLGGVNFYSGVVKGVSFLGVVRERG